MMLLKDAVQRMHIEDRKELIELISSCRNIDEILTYDIDCDRITLLRKRRQLQKRIAILLARAENIRQQLEKEEHDDRESISPKRERKPLGLFRKRKGKGLDSGA